MDDDTTVNIKLKISLAPQKTPAADKKRNSIVADASAKDECPVHPGQAEAKISARRKESLIKDTDQEKEWAGIPYDSYVRYNPERRASLVEQKEQLRERRGSQLAERSRKYSIAVPERRLSHSESRPDRSPGIPPMPTKVVEVLKKCDGNHGDNDIIVAAWQAIKKNVVMLLLNKDLGVPVPYLADGHLYDLQSVIVKEEKSLKNKIMGKISAVCYMAQLATILSGTKSQREASTHRILGDSSAAKRGPDTVVYHLRNNENQPEKVLELKLSVYHLEEHNIKQNLRDTNIHLNKRIDGLHTIEKAYLVTKVWKAKYVFVVTVGNRKVHFSTEMPQPIIFEALECNIKGEIMNVGETSTGKLRGYDWKPYDNDAKRFTKKLSSTSSLVHKLMGKKKNASKKKHDRPGTKGEEEEDTQRAESEGEDHQKLE